MDDLQRFMSAQAGVYETALSELKAGRKRSHWMWFVLPQIAGLGFSAMAQRYAISGEVEARAYLVHPILGSRLRETVAAVLAHPDKTAHTIFGSPDNLKFRSSLTLFEAVADDPAPFTRTLETFYDGVRDGETLRRLGRS
ncbi:MAG: DUF1810 domain-containing protein [Rhodobiaceae bacterium]|nr:DUF1810 domain-containing protein [Rhodobiaceae bacterium]